MFFNSLPFLVFLPVVVVGFYTIPRRGLLPFLLVASYGFYGAGRVEHVPLLLGVTLVSHVAALRIGRTAEESRRRLWLGIALAANLGVLGVFKYSDFAARILNAVLSWLGVGAALPLPRLHWPLGISFFTLQALAYVFEVYLGRFPAEPDGLRVALYVAYFPLLAAGPIERPERLLPQLRERARLDCEALVSGLRLMLWGFFKKVVVADRLGPLVDTVYGGGAQNGLTYLLATYGFAMQIYCDFSGYSDIARGTARLLGVDVVRNFDSPYAACSIVDFWRRWHVALSSWLRDYVFMPLSLGGRRSRLRLYASLMAAFVASGIWHGPDWTFVAWGALHGVYIVVGLLTRRARDRAWGPWAKSRTREWVAWAVTFQLVCASWVLFRAPSVPRAAHILASIAREAPVLTSHLFRGAGILHGVADFSRFQLLGLVLLSAAVMGAEWGASQRWFPLTFQASPSLRLAAYFVLFYTIVFFGYFGETAFIYSRF